MSSWTFLFVYLFIYFIVSSLLLFLVIVSSAWIRDFAGSLALVSFVLGSILMPLLGFQVQRCLLWIVHFFYASFVVPVPFLSLSKQLYG